MKKLIITLILLLAIPSAALLAQTEIEFKLNDFYSVKLRQISENEYTNQKEKSEQLRHKPYEVITDIAEAQKMLGERLIFFEMIEDDVLYDKEITFNDNTKKRFTWEVEFVAYYPELQVLLFQYDSGGDYSIDLSDSANEHVGNPQYHVVSPDKQFRINAEGPDVVREGYAYFLEKWNPEKKKYEFIDYFSDENTIFYYSHDWFWTSNSTTLFSRGWEERYYEMELIAN